MALGIVDLLQISVVAHFLDSGLKGDDLVIARHHDHRAKFEPLGEVRGADREIAATGLRPVIEHFERHPRSRYRRTRPLQLCRRPHEDAKLVREGAVPQAFGDPSAMLFLWILVIVMRTPSGQSNYPKGRAPKPSFHISGPAIRSRHRSPHEFIEERNRKVHIAVRGAIDHSFPD